jgi:Bacterial PH domain
MTYRLAPMSPDVLVVTLVLLPLPLVFLVLGALWTPLLFAPAGFILVIYAWIWLLARPTAFVVHSRAIEITWPLKRQEIPRGDIEAVRIIDRQTLRREAGWGMRVGAGGLFGAFGYLWTTRRGLVRMFVSRTDRFVWIERRSERPWLITPDQPDAFVRALSIHG